MMLIQNVQYSDTTIIVQFWSFSKYSSFYYFLKYFFYIIK